MSREWRRADAVWTGVAPILVWSWVLAAARLEAATVHRDESVLFFPRAAWRSADGKGWVAELEGRIFEFESRRLTLSTFQAGLGLGGTDLGERERELFLERARWFLVDTEKGKKIAVLTGGQRVELPASSDGGVIRGEVTWMEQGARTESGPVRRVRVAVELGAGDQREVVSSVVLLPEVGVSVISDIDDTIKVSEVRDRRALLVNTFFRPYLAVEGMARLYATWMERYGVTVHYLSGSPWPLYEALSSFTAQAGFPEGTWHLRDFAWDRDVLADLMAAPADYKRRELDRFATRWPKRRLILVGDSGEQDPEIYGAFSRANPGRVLGILIRDVTGEGSGSARYAEAFHDLPEGRWHVFRQSNALPVKVDPWFKENRRD